MGPCPLLLKPHCHVSVCRISCPCSELSVLSRLIVFYLAVWSVTAEEKRAAKAARVAALAAMSPEEKAAMEAEKQAKKASRKRKSAVLDENGEPKKRGAGLAKELRCHPTLNISVVQRKAYGGGTYNDRIVLH